MTTSPTSRRFILRSTKARRWLNTRRLRSSSTSKNFKGNSSATNSSFGLRVLMWEPGMKPRNPSILTSAPPRLVANTCDRTVASSACSCRTLSQARIYSMRRMDRVNCPSSFSSVRMKNSLVSFDCNTSSGLSTRLMDISWIGMYAAVLAPISIRAPLGSILKTVPATTSPGLKW